MPARNHSPHAQRRYVAAARELLRTEPPSSISTRDVAQAVGVSQPALFKHFDSRDTLFSAVVKELSGELTMRLLAHVGDSPRQALDAVVSELLQFAVAAPELPRLLIFDAGEGSDSSFHADLRALVTKQRSLFRALVEGAVERGDFPAELDAPAASAALVALLQGTLASWLHDGRREDPLPLGRMAFDVWSAGIRTGTPRKSKSQKAPSRRRVSFDLGPWIAEGTDPFEAILDAFGSLRDGGVLELRAPFEPRPMMRLLSARGARVQHRCSADGSHEVQVTRLGKRRTTGRQLS